MTISKELLDAYRWNRQQTSTVYNRHGQVTGLRGNGAATALDRARFDVANHKARYPHTGKPYAAVNWSADTNGLAYVQSVDGAGLRHVGDVESESHGGRDCWSNRGACGWYTDPYGDSSRDGTGLCWGVVYQLPARDGKARFVAGYQMGGYDAGPTLDMSTIFQSESARGDYVSSASDHEDARDAARSADSMAQRAAELERDYQTAWQAGSQYAGRLELIAESRASLKALLIERRAAKRLWQAGAHLSTICGAIADKAQSLIAAIHEAKDECAKLAGGDFDQLYFYAGDRHLRDAFNEGAGLQVLA